MNVYSAVLFVANIILALALTGSFFLGEDTDAALAEEFKYLTKALKELENEKDRLNSEVSKEQNLRASAEKRTENFNQEKARLEETLDQQKRENTELRLGLGEQQEQLESLRVTLQDRDHGIVEFQEQLGELESLAQSQRATIQQRDDTISALEERIATLQPSADTVETQAKTIADLHADLSDLQERLSAVINVPIPRPRPCRDLSFCPKTGSGTTVTSPPPPSSPPPPAPSFQTVSATVSVYRFDNTGNKINNLGPRQPEVNARLTRLVSQREYRRFCRASNRVQCPAGIGDSSAPVTGISWNNANQYMAWLSGHTGQRYRFPYYPEIAAAAARGLTAGVNEWSSRYGASAQVVMVSANPVDATLAPVGQGRSDVGFRLARD